MVNPTSHCAKSENRQVIVKVGVVSVTVNQTPHCAKSEDRQVIVNVGGIASFYYHYAVRHTDLIDRSPWCYRMTTCIIFPVHAMFLS